MNGRAGVELSLWTIPESQRNRKPGTGVSRDELPVSGYAKHITVIRIIYIMGNYALRFTEMPNARLARENNGF